MQIRILFCIAQIPLSIEVKIQPMGIKLQLKHINYQFLKLICKFDNGLEGPLSAVKRFIDHIRMQFVQEKYTNVAFKKSSEADSHNFSLDINTEITE